METKPKLRRARAPDLQRYVPPALRGLGAQQKVSQKNITVLDENTNLEKNTRNNERRIASAGNTSLRCKAVASDRVLSEISDASCNNREGEFIKLDLSKCTVGEFDFPKVSHTIENTDVVIESKEGEKFPISMKLLVSRSPYFSCMFKNEWQETTEKVIKTEIVKQSLQPVAKFLISGEVVLTNSNVMDIFEVAEYFQIECLADLCRNFTLARLSTLCHKAILYGTKHPAMVPVAEKAMDYLSENFLKVSEEILMLEPYLLMPLLSRDDLNVGCEDQVCDLVLQWLQRVQDDEIIRQMVECIRLPHLTSKSFERLCKAVGETSAPVIDLVKSGRFIELSEDQLARRLFYNRHIHAVWKHSNTYPAQPIVDHDEEFEFRIDCIQCKDEKIISTDEIQSFRDFREHRTIFEFVPIMNTLHMVTHSKPFKYLLIYQQMPDGRWKKCIQYMRKAAMPDFAASVEGTELHLTIFDGFSSPLKTLRFQPLTFSNAQVVDYQAPFKMHFSPPKMLFHEDFAIFMVDCIKICDRTTNDVSVIDVPSDKSTHGAMRKFTDILRYENTLYAYEEIPVDHRNDTLISDRIHIINLTTKEVESVVDVVCPSVRSASTEMPANKKFTTPKMFVNGSRLVVALYFADLDCYTFMEFDPEKNIFNIVADITSAQRSAPLGFSRKLVTTLPVRLHHCKHETLLQKHCNSLGQPCQTKQLNQLQFYL